MTHKTAHRLPTFCDYTCIHAAFAPQDASGACRREQAVFCSLKKKYNNKNARCLASPANTQQHPTIGGSR